MVANLTNKLRVLDPRVWPSRLVARYVALIFLVGFFIANYSLWNSSKSWDIPSLHSPVGFGSKHPIKKLMMDARTLHEEKLSRRSYDLHDAAARYREARGRHPPPGFDRWFEAALNTDSVVVEDYFDRIYKDLAPWWAMEPQTIKKHAHSWPWVVRVRNGTAFGDGNTEGRVPWLQLWSGFVGEIADHLPDVDMPINYMDEPRLLVPFKQVAKLVDVEKKERVMPELDAVTTEYGGLADIDSAKPDKYDPKWSGPDKQYWNLAVKACSPKSPAHGVKAMTDYKAPAEFPRNYDPEYAYHGFISNWTMAMDPCEQPHLRGLHGSFVEPISLSSTDEFIPLFGGSKLPINNEILIPGAMYLTDDEFYSGGDTHGPPWNKKKNGVVWRGDASGGRAKPDTWHHFQRHRLIDMFNATTIEQAEKGNGRSMTFELPDTSIYESPHTLQKNLAAWIRGFADVGFVRMCPPDECKFIFEHFKEIESRPMREQYEYKFLPDADGNSFSARFRGFMRSTSVPLKATIYAEWHDDRLVPWVHFIPLDNTFRDLYPALEYFSGSREGDTAARFIAERGQKWSEQVLRREDMRLYVWRLLLEWARVCDENRHSLGYVGDLM
ncbi:hypothetical protein ACO1O0_002130 [Amphichorda felina]